MVSLKHWVSEYTDHRVVAIVLGSKGRGPQRPCHGEVEVIPGDRASSIRVIVIGRSSRYGSLISVDIRLIFSIDQKCLLSKKDIWVVQ